MSQADIRQYDVEARSTDVFGRVLCSSRHHHFVADGPVQNGCPGEALTPAELFLSGVAGCGVELIQVLAREQNLPLEAVDVAISGVLDRSNPVRTDLALFNAVRLRFFLKGVSDEEGAQLIESFKRR
jgi:uncharacterized OsmC-like protein